MRMGLVSDLDSKYHSRSAPLTPVPTLDQPRRKILSSGLPLLIDHRIQRSISPRRTTTTTTTAAVEAGRRRRTRTIPLSVSQLPLDELVHLHNQLGGRLSGYDVSSACQFLFYLVILWFIGFGGSDGVDEVCELVGLLDEACIEEFEAGHVVSDLASSTRALTSSCSLGQDCTSS